MKLYSFDYVTEGEITPRRRFVGSNKNYGLVLDGYDLLDNFKFKYYNMKKIVNFKNYGDFDQVALQNSKILSRSEVYSLLTYPAGAECLLDGMSPTGLSELVQNKTGNELVVLDDNLFLFVPKCIIVDFMVKNYHCGIKIMPNKIEYYIGDTVLSDADFIKNVLS